MLFTEPAFLFVFLPAMLAASAWGSLRLRNAVLAVGSLVFYAWDYAPYLIVLCLSIGLNFLAGLHVGQGGSERRRRWAIWLGIAGNLLLLGYYKYAGFLCANLNALLAGLGWPVMEFDPPTLPLGISFFTFQAMSYLMDVYRGRTEAQRRLPELALYIALFPQLIAGPIVRYQEIAGQIRSRVVRARGFSRGIARFVIGLGKKLLIADTLAKPAEIVFGLSLNELTTPLAWLGLTCFSLQIYFDFSGYSDMAIGLGRMFGFRIPENFNHPYAARSVTEFWRRWHITLSRWFRDYLYIPLGGNRRGPARTYFNLFVVFLLCGFWHGASWNFVFWGFLHGTFLTMERIFPVLRQSPPVWGVPYALAAVLLGWVFFQCETLGHAFGFLSVLGGASFGGMTFYEFRDLFTNDVALVFAFAVPACAPVLPLLRGRLARWLRRTGDRAGRRRRSGLIALGANLALTLLFSACCIRAMADTYTPFLYFRF